MHRTAIAGGASALQPLADIVVRDDGCLLLEVRIPAGVVLVKVGIDDEPHRLVRNALERSLNSLARGAY